VLTVEGRALTSSGPVASRYRPPRTFEAFFAAEYHRVLAVVVALVGSRTGAEDIAQEAFIRAYSRWQQVAAMANPEAWVKRVAVNLATSRARRVAAEARAVLRMGRRNDAVDMPLQDADFWSAVRSLPARQAQAVALRYADDLDVAQIADVMECAPGTVKAHLHAARKRLEAAFDAPGEAT
jgi:RNA polymerase sigma-70 factor (ECF subfamily)